MRRLASVLLVLTPACSLLLGSTPARGQAVGERPLPGLTTARPESTGIRVAGEVARPGVYDLTTGSPQLVDVIRRAGGLARNASGNIRIVSDGRADRQTFYSPLLDFRLSPGDLVVVDPRPGREHGVRTVGYSVRPGALQPAIDESARDESAKSVPVFDEPAIRPDRRQAAGESHESAGRQQVRVPAGNPNILIGFLLVLLAGGLLWSTTRFRPVTRCRPVSRPGPALDRRSPIGDQVLEVPRRGDRRTSASAGSGDPATTGGDSSAGSAGNKQNGLLDRVLARVHGA